MSTILSALQRFCAYRDRSRFETSQKALKLGANALEIEVLLQQLEKEGFLNDLRFAEAFCRGKLLQNGWGKWQILQGLDMHRIPKSTVQTAWEKIPRELYLSVLQKEALKKWGLLKGNPLEVRKQKLLRFLTGKGFETSLCLEVLDDLHLNE